MGKQAIQTVSKYHLVDYLLISMLKKKRTSYNGETGRYLGTRLCHVRAQNDPCCYWAESPDHLRRNIVAKKVYLESNQVRKQPKTARHSIK